MLKLYYKFVLVQGKHVLQIIKLVSYVPDDECQY
jgi:hypothetical protein